MKVRSSLTRWGLLLLLALVAPFVCAAVDSGYENAKNAAMGWTTQCTAHADDTGPWGGSLNGVPKGGFAACNCTSYVAYRLRLNNVRHNGELFVNWGWGGTSVHWSHGGLWGDSTKLSAVSVRKDNYPAVGSVAQWDVSSTLTYGHVAYVQHIFTHPNDGRITSIGIMEYNWANPVDHQYRYRRIAHQRGNYPTNFLHFEEKGTDADNTNATCVTGLASSPPGANAGAFCWKHQSNTNATCESASSYHFYDYRTCTRYDVNSSTSPPASQYCQQVGNNPGYTIRISGTSFPESIAPSANGTDFASCPAGSTGTGNSREVSGRLPPHRAKFWHGLDNVLN